MKTAVLIICIFGCIVFIGAYIQRGELAYGPEYILPIILAGIIPLKEVRK